MLLVYDLLLYSPEVCLMDFVGTVLNSCLCSVAQWRRDLTDLSLLLSLVGELLGFTSQLGI